jgi:cell division protein FtsA
MLPRKLAGEAASEVVALLDIGTTKIACMIVELSPAARHAKAIGAAVPARLRGFGVYRSKGIKAGVVVDLGDAEQAIRAAVGRAETDAGLTVEEVYVSVACGRLKSLNFSANTPVAGERVSDADVERVLVAGRGFAERDGRALLHLHRLGYRIDGEAGIVNPRGMAGSKLAIDLNAVTVDETPLRNLLLLVQRCFLTVAGLVATPYASGLAVITEEEARLGVTVVDFGGGTTTISVFADGHFVFADAIALGGGHISYDIARRLSTPLYEAERIKTVYGNLVGAPSDERELISYSLVGDGEQGLYHTDRARLRAIVTPRAEEMLGLVRERLSGSGFGAFAASRLVLTGGASQLAGLPEFASHCLGATVRIGTPRPVAGMPANLAQPAFATLIGMGHALIAPGLASGIGGAEAAGTERPGALGRFGQWLKESFWDDDSALG